MPQDVIPQENEEAKESNEAESKHPYDGFRGALDVDLDKAVKGDGTTLRDELSKHVTEVLSQEIRNQAPRMQEMQTWEDNYAGRKPPKQYPWPDAANVCTPLTRSNTDAIHVRLVDALFNKRKMWMIRARDPLYVGIDRQLEEALDWFQKNILKFRQKLQSPLIQCIKTGTGIVKIGWRSDKRTVYRYATTKERLNPKVRTYPLPGTKARAVKVVQTLYEGPQVYPVPREDFVISADATTIQDAYIVGFRTRVRLPQLKLKAKQGIYDKDSVEDISPGSRVDENLEGRVIRQEKDVRYTVDETMPIDVWETWLSYDVDGDGEPDDIVVTIHRESGKILRCVYNPMFLGFRPFVALVFYPREYAVDGEGVAEILANVQQEIDSLHNQRLDRLTQINSPVLFVRSGSSLEDLEVLEPGNIYVVDDELDTALREFRFSDTTFSTYQEEQMLRSDGDRAVGITPNVLGIQTAERPVAKETFANIQEANKKFKFGIDNLRIGISEIGYMLIEFFAQYRPKYKYINALTEGKKRKLTEATVEFPLEYIRDGLFIDLYASTEFINQETRRDIHMTLYSLLSDYYSKTAGMVQAILDPNVPSEFKKFLTSIIDKGDKRLDQIMKEFDQVDGESYLVNLQETIDIAGAIENSVDLRPPAPEPEPPVPPGPNPGPPGPQPPPVGAMNGPPG